MTWLELKKKLNKIRDSELNHDIVFFDGTSKYGLYPEDDIEISFKGDKKYSDYEENLETNRDNICYTGEPAIIFIYHNQED